MSLSPHTQDNLPPRPLLRGWSHALGAVVALGFTVAMLVASAGDVPRMIALLIFGLSMIQMYTVSAFYHIGRWSTRTHRVLRSLDHSNIFVLIAGTYTPVLVVALAGWGEVAMLATVWIIAIAGVLLSVLKLNLPRWVGTLLYIGMGWISIFIVPAVWNSLSGAAVALMALGGVLYTIGAVIYALKRPNPFPRVFGFHEIFHLFVIAGSATFAIVVWVWTVPHSAV